MSESEETSHVKVISEITTTFEDEMSEFLTEKYNEGYELLYPPIFVGDKVLGGSRPRQEPHFLVVLIRR